MRKGTVYQERSERQVKYLKISSNSWGGHQTLSNVRGLWMKEVMKGGQVCHDFSPGSVLRQDNHVHNRCLCCPDHLNGGSARTRKHYLLTGWARRGAVLPFGPKHSFNGAGQARVPFHRLMFPFTRIDRRECGNKRRRADL